MDKRRFETGKDDAALNPKRVLTTCVLAAVAGLGIASLNAQGNELVIQQRIRTNHLSAVVVDPTGAAIPEAEISLFKCPAGDFNGTLLFTPITKTLTDQRGRFSLPWLSKRVCLQAKSPGLNLLQIEILRDPNASKLRVVLTPGT